ncbi:phage tail assembly chaperone [Falsiroseomonas sp. CW058]|uniref:phage tail assembly chaperone n=1 Tax=Falsiroseomonas sp. CW058 TaxID=3388664 RepID=UPI003D31638A
MVAHLRHEVSLDQRLPTGESQRDALERVAEITGKRPRELDAAPGLPHGTERLYDIFAQLSAGRSYGMSGPMPLSSLEIQAWCSLTGQRLDGWELTAIRRLDAAWIKASNKPDERPDGA